MDIHPFDYWVNVKGWMTSQPFVDPTFGPGTDLGGGLWGHDPTLKGATQHGLGDQCFNPPCGPSTIADGFVFGVAPDRKVSMSSVVDVVPIVPIPPIFPPHEDPLFSAPLCGPYCPEPLLGGEAQAEPFMTVDASLKATFWYRSGIQSSAART